MITLYIVAAIGYGAALSIIWSMVKQYHVGKKRERVKRRLEMILNMESQRDVHTSSGDARYRIRDLVNKDRSLGEKVIMKIDFNLTKVKFKSKALLRQVIRRYTLYSYKLQVKRMLESNLKGKGDNDEIINK